ncbi:MAG: Nif11-like leader peptide family RiPP precursor [Burkholderiales bacterium]
MTMQALEAFRSKVSGDTLLQSEVQKAFAPAGQGVVAVGKKHGYEFSVDEALALLGSTHGELNDFELELVAGGNSIDCNPNSNGAGRT